MVSILYIARQRRVLEHWSFDSPIRSLGFQVAATLLIVGILVVSSQALSPTSFWSNSNVVRAIGLASHPEQIQHVSIDEFLAFNRVGESIAIDARLPGDYFAGHVEGSISLPVTSQRSERAFILKDVPKTSKLVIYCQSRSCLFAQSVATLLVGDGYYNVSILDGGWVELEGRCAVTKPNLVPQK